MRVPRALASSGSPPSSISELKRKWNEGTSNYYQLEALRCSLDYLSSLCISLSFLSLLLSLHLCISLNLSLSLSLSLCLCLSVCLCLSLSLYVKKIYIYIYVFPFILLPSPKSWLTAREELLYCDEAPAVKLPKITDEDVKGFKQAYDKLVAERGAEGIPPPALDAKQAQAVCELLKSPPDGHW